jgi:8-oxo-dGTP pyrophosphatase MutT (NUDIX family)
MASPDPVPNAELRLAGRVILLDADDRVLLIHERSDIDSQQTHWLVPGGGVELAESTAEAAARELAEETGLLVPITDAEPVHIERHSWSHAGRHFDQTNHYFLARTAARRPAAEPRSLTDLEKTIVLGWRWWSIEDLAASTAEIWPANLADLLRRHRSG